MKRIACLFVLFLLFGPLIGCGGPARPSDMPRLYPCELTVTSESVPFADAMIGFYSTDPEFKWGIGAITGADGKARMVTHGQYFGVPEGDYVVTVMKTEREEFDPEKPPRTVKVFTYTAPEYTERSTTPLKISIGKGKKVETLEIGKTEKQVLRSEPPF